MSWETDNNTQEQRSVTILLAGPVERVNAWYSTLQMDSRFRVNSFATDPQDTQAKLATNPEVLLLDAQFYGAPEPLVNFLTGFQGAAYVVLPPNASDEAIGIVKAVPSAKAVFRGDANLSDLTGRMYGDALALRRQAPVNSVYSPQRRDTVSGLRIISVWNRVGGAGKSTLSIALAGVAAQRGLRTLLIGLGAPDIVPLVVGLDQEPNITHWMANPSTDGFQNALQRAGEIDVLAGFPDTFSEAPASSLRPDNPASIPNLITGAAYAGYAAIIVDTPVSSVAPLVISAANTWVLVARPTLADSWASYDAFRSVMQRMAGQHRIGGGNVLVALNQARQGLLTQDEWHEAANAACRQAKISAFPPVAVSIPDTPQVALAMNAGRSPLDSSDGFSRPVHQLADALFGRGSENGKVDGSVVKIGPVRIRKGK